MAEEIYVKWFPTFCDMFCTLKPGAWVGLGNLHVAFADFLVYAGIPIEWVNRHVTTNYNMTIKYANTLGVKAKGNGAHGIFVNISLHTYPFQAIDTKTMNV